MHAKVALLVKVELKKSLQVKVIRPIDYLERIYNLLSINKYFGVIHICIDFYDLNKECPKDDFTFPNIAIIIDMTTRYEMFSFQLSLMDGFLGQNQIRIAHKDQHKTTFTCPQGTYCWNVIPFSLKNVGAPYQRVMTTIFHVYMHILTEDYVDDLL